MDKKLRYRIAPSPSGNCHVGLARIALFNWLLAKKNGSLILRVEDTNSSNSTKESCDNILDALEWLGLNWDEGPRVGGNYGSYFQSERTEIYRSYADKLVDSGNAYRCLCSKSDLELMKTEFAAKYPKSVWKYPGICRDKNVSKNVPHVVRFKVPENENLSFTDLVFGKVDLNTSSMYDEIILRESGEPLYNFAATIDDHLMEIDTVFRGRDHLSNTFQQLLIYKALGWAPSEFAHAPLILNAEGQKLAKRDGAASVEAFRELGFSANGLLNYLCRFGWSHKDAEIFSMNELINLFDFKGCKKSDGKFDMEKALAINAKNMVRSDLVSDETYMADLKHLSGIDDPKVLPIVRGKAKTFVEAKQLLGFLNKSPTTFVANSKENLLIRDVAKELFALDSFTKAPMLNFVKEYCTKNNLQLKDVAQLIRLWITSETSGPDIFQVLEYFGKDTIGFLVQNLDKE